MPVQLPIIGVMGSHEQDWADYSVPLGQLIARRGYHLLTGAGAGVMTSVAKGFISVQGRKGHCLGICPIAPNAYRGLPLSPTEFPNPYIEISLAVPLDGKAQNDAVPYSRNMMNVMTAHALVILPGAHGTRNEVSLALMYNKPIVLFGPDSGFASFPQEPLRTDKIAHVEQFFDDVVGG